MLIGYARCSTDTQDLTAQPDGLTATEVKFNISGSLHDPNDPIGRLLFTVLAIIAEFESDLIRTRTREDMKVTKAKGRLRGKPPKLNPTQETHLVGLYQAGQHTTTELAELFSVGRSTAYRGVQRSGDPADHGAFVAASRTGLLKIAEFGVVGIGIAGD